MSAKKLSIYLADESLKILEVIGGQQNDEIELNLSSSLNLAVQFCGLVTQQKLKLTPGELLFCCDICNGGAHLTEFQTPDSVSIKAALESMTFGLFDAAENDYGGEVGKWAINKDHFMRTLDEMSEPELFVLAMATRQFWSGIELAGFKNITNSGDYEAWAGQWVS